MVPPDSQEGIDPRLKRILRGLDSFSTDLATYNGGQYEGYALNIRGLVELVIIKEDSSLREVWDRK